MIRVLALLISFFAAPTSSTVRNVPAEPDPPQRRIKTELAASLKEGMSRAEVVSVLGEPTGGLAIAGGQSDYEDMAYLLEPTGELTVRLEKGKVVRIFK